MQSGLIHMAMASTHSNINSIEYFLNPGKQTHTNTHVDMWFELLSLTTTPPPPPPPPAYSNFTHTNTVWLPRGKIRKIHFRFYSRQILIIGCVKLSSNLMLIEFISKTYRDIAGCKQTRTFEIFTGCWGFNFGQCVFFINLGQYKKSKLN